MEYKDNKLNILKKLALIADALDEAGSRKEANSLTNIMIKLSQQAKPNYFTLAGLPADGSGYSGAADQNERLRAAISKQHNANFPDFYSAYQKAFGTFTNNMEDRKKNLRGDASNSATPVANPAAAPGAVSNLSPAAPGNTGDNSAAIDAVIEGMTALASNSTRNTIFKASQSDPQFAQNTLNQQQVLKIVNAINQISRNLANVYGQMGLAAHAEECIRFSANALKMYETVEHGNLYASGLETYIKSVYDSVDKVGFSDLTGDVQIEIRSKLFKNLIPLAIKIAQIMDNVTNYVSGLGAGNGSVPVRDKLRRAIGAMKTGEKQAPQEELHSPAPQEQLYSPKLASRPAPGKPTSAFQ